MMVQHDALSLMWPLLQTVQVPGARFSVTTTVPGADITTLTAEDVKGKFKTRCNS